MSEPEANIRVLLRQCWISAVKSGNPDTVDQVWRGLYAGVLDDERERYRKISEGEQAALAGYLRELAGEWTDWVTLRLSVCAPFRDWRKWCQAVGAPLPAVANTRNGGCLLPIHLYVLPREVNVPEEDTRKVVVVELPAEDYRTRNPIWWPYGRSIPGDPLRAVPAVLWHCVLRNLIGISLDPFALVLLCLSVCSTLGIAIWGYRSETLFEGLLAASLSFSLWLFIWAVCEAWQEILRVRRERWLFHWKDSIVRIAGDPDTDLIDLGGVSFGLEAILAAFVGLRTRVRASHAALESRFAAAMEKLKPVPATGCLTGPFSLLIGGVGDVRDKWAAVEKAEERQWGAADLTQFLVPVSRRTVFDRIGQVVVPDDHKVRLRPHRLVAIALLKLAGAYRRSALPFALAILALAIPMQDEWRMAKRLNLPRLVSSELYYQSAQGIAVNFLRLKFSNVHGDPSGFSVVVRGSALEQPNDAEVLPVQGLADLREDGRSGDGVVDIKLRGYLRPHSFTVDLIEHRRLPGLDLANVRVATFGLLDIRFVSADSSGPAEH
ncbi:MAG TPA: hypothetical protein VHU83_04380 [Bryobacteraceae bacterium]|jgi:hypothetical protein|nr:hypothetical protein [Bryobacteraceae bacterium]